MIKIGRFGPGSGLQGWVETEKWRGWRPNRGDGSWRSPAENLEKREVLSVVETGGETETNHLDWTFLRKMANVPFDLENQRYFGVPRDLGFWGSFESDSP